MRSTANRALDFRASSRAFEPCALFAVCCKPCALFAENSSLAVGRIFTHAPRGESAGHTPTVPRCNPAESLGCPACPACPAVFEGHVRARACAHPRWRARARAHVRPSKVRGTRGTSYKENEIVNYYRGLGVPRVCPAPSDVPR